MKKSLKDFTCTRFLDGPADDAVIVTSGPIANGFLLHWDHGTILEYEEYFGKRTRISLHKGPVKAAKLVRGVYRFQMKGLTHIYVYAASLDLMVYAGLYPLSDPLDLKIRQI